jgi:hypothetical protein
MGRAFTGAYRARGACALKLPLYATLRYKHFTVCGRPRNLARLFTDPKRVANLKVLLFEETGGCAKPRSAWSQEVRRRLMALRHFTVKK